MHVDIYVYQFAREARELDPCVLDTFNNGRWVASSFKP